MTVEEAKAILDQLRNGEMKTYRVNKENFLAFRAVLVAQADMKDFRGNAQHGGEAIYTYEPGWTK
ncbi:hypothetical protein RYX56_14345 [Alkalihalophilus lindianensis]|uniref:Uncharacterized protein n=1 Tax=Alkalihalophilus lindianensis TaxID=1630542 RepID=A0ABU3XCH7_9BACI|nr:hypothetical protein [Alkalihalophilus lindianensis]MDV2685543.1 hypothetical protein [Alkalihalophilus lindianensis]